MSNVSSDFLHSLVATLDKSEKRYFKLYLNKQGDRGDGHYERLFDAMSKQELYNEGAILTKFKKEEFTKRFSVTKNRLYNHLLSALSAYHGNSSVSAKLYRSLHHIEILYSKALYKQCKKVLISVEKVAHQFEEHLVLLEVFNWKNRINQKLNYADIKRTDQQLLVSEQQQLLERISKESELLDAKYQVFATLYQKGKSRSEADRHDLRNLMSQLNDGIDYDELHGSAKYHFNHVSAAYQYHINDHKKSLEFVKRNIELLENGVCSFSSEPMLLFNLLSNAVYEASRLKNIKEADRQLKKLNDLSDRTKDLNQKERNHLFVLRSTTNLAYCQLNGLVNRGLIEAAHIESSMDDLRTQIKDLDKAGLYFSMATLYISAGLHNDALKCLNRILNALSIQQSEDLFCFAQMLHLVTHIELDNKEFLSYALKSTKRFLLTRKRVHKFESAFLDLVKSLSRAKNEHMEQVAFGRFILSVREIRKDEFERNAFEYFDFLSWAERKVTDEELRLSA